ncbi:MAG: hypothetical protein ACI8QS_002870 [Planctomycetota bacterium]|jgi:hypothetical protein
MHKGLVVLGPVGYAVAGLVPRMDSGVHREVIGRPSLMRDAGRQLFSRKVPLCTNAPRKR